mmetsp:Transcript_26255/g.55754  ORF Transcript_26255/g.55754 Transcript_26255/m.55754 type:complete len:272 (-) Transcript_26255:53-868(-)
MGCDLPDGAPSLGEEACVKIVARSAVTGEEKATVRLLPSSTLKQLREAIAVSINEADITTIRLLSNGKILEGLSTLCDAGLADGAIIDVVRLVKREWLDWTVFPMMVIPYAEEHRCALRAKATSQAREEDWEPGSLFCNGCGQHWTRPDAPGTSSANTASCAPAEEPSHLRRRTVDFAVKAAADRERRLESLIQDGPGLCVGSVPRRWGTSRDSINARWDDWNQDVNGLMDMYKDTPKAAPRVGSVFGRKVASPRGGRSRRSTHLICCRRQ